MTNRQMKKEMAAKGYELAYGFNMQEGKRGWSIRKYGTTNEIYIGAKVNVEYCLAD